MWRFIRLGIKNDCAGNHIHFRILGTTCANADCDDKTEELNPAFLNEKQISSNNYNENFASNEFKKFQKSLQYKENIADQKKVNNWEHENLNLNPLRKIIWKNYVEGYADEEKRFTNQRSVIKSSQSKNSNGYCSDSHNLKHDCEKEFGSLSKSSRTFDLLPDEEDDDSEKLILDNRLSAQQYGRKILQLCKERKLKEALDIFEIEMKNENVTPDLYCYNILINACGKIGYTKKAFSLYYQMKQRGLKIEKFAYTGLFNACANSPFKDEALLLAKNLLKHLKDKEILLHPITYHAMIKAFGHCGDIKLAFDIVDEMVMGGHAVKTETLNFLLQACISNKEAGFRHALMVWRKMRTMYLTPDIFSYNLLLRCVKECDGGDPRLLNEIFEDAKENQKLKGRLRKIREKAIQNFKSNNSSNQFQKNKLGSKTMKKNLDDQNISLDGENKIGHQEQFCQIGDKNEIVKVNLAENMEMEIVSREENASSQSSDVMPNILSYFINPGSVISISSLQKCDERLWLLGGVSGILQSMKEDRVKPTITTFTFLLESLPSNAEVEEMLLKSIANCQIKPDVIFFNKLIRKRCLRKAYTEATDVLDLMQQHRVCVDLISFGCLSIGCRKPSDIKQFLIDMKKAGFTPNDAIMGSLIRNCLRTSEYVFVIELLQRLKSFGLEPNEELLKSLEFTRAKIKEKIIKQEVAANEKISPWEKRKQEEMRVFLMEYKYWLKKTPFSFKDHPWAQFGHKGESKAVVKCSPT